MNNIVRAYKFVILMLIGIFLCFWVLNTPEKSDGSDDTLEEKKNESANLIDHTKYPFKSIKSISEIDGYWKLLREDGDVVFFDTKNMVIQFNQLGHTSPTQLKLEYLDLTDRDEFYQEFYVYGVLGSSKVFEAKVLINQEMNRIYIDRTDGGVSNYYDKYAYTDSKN